MTNIPTNKFTTNILCVLLRRPLLRSEVTKNALLPPLIARGSARYPTLREMRLAAESLSGSIFDAQIIKKGEHQILQFFLECVDLDTRALDFLQEVVQNPLIIPFFESERENLRSRIEARINNKSEHALQLCLKAMCAGEPFGLYGDGYTEDLADITPQGLFDHYKSMENFGFIALGDYDEKWLEGEIAARFGTPAHEEIPKAALRPARASRQIIKQNHGSAQGNLCIGLRGEDIDFVHFQLLNEILGGGANSRLFANIREKEGLCYAIHSNIYRFKSLMTISAGCEPRQMERVTQLAENELKRGNFTAEEISNAKQALRRRWQTIQDRPSASVDFYATQNLLQDPRTIDELLGQAEEATPEGIAQAADKLNIDTVVMIK